MLACLLACLLACPFFPNRVSKNEQRIGLFPIVTGASPGSLNLFRITEKIKTPVSCFLFPKTNYPELLIMHFQIASFKRNVCCLVNCFPSRRFSCFIYFSCYFFSFSSPTPQVEVYKKKVWNMLFPDVRPKCPVKASCPVEFGTDGITQGLADKIQCSISLIKPWDEESLPCSWQDYSSLLSPTL